MLISPDSSLLLRWNQLLMVICIYTAGYAPFRTAFMSFKASNTLWMFETGCDILMLIDIIISFFTIFEKLDGSQERNMKRIASRYVR